MATPLTPNELVQRGQALEKEGELEQAVACYDNALVLDPRSADAWYAKGCALASLGRHPEAVACFQKATEVEPARALAWFNMGNVLQTMGEVGRAVECFDRAAELAPRHPDPLVNKGRLLDDGGDHEGAIACYDRALNLWADDPVAWANRGDSLKALGRYEQALDSYDRALKHDSQDPAALFGSVDCLAALREIDRGLERVDRALALYPDHGPGLCNKAVLLGHRGRYADALKYLRRAAELEPLSPEIWTNMGEVYGQLSGWPDALSAFDIALTHAPSYRPALFGKARALLCLGNRPGCAVLCRRFLEGADGKDGEDELIPTARQMLAMCDDSWWTNV